ncbi:MAG: sulfatase-like hydrolase/transferase [Elusimicrobia bacterium]|nr:sulfatase-like hydrolase/transferase [Elusimicrobiota bacterium]
MRKLSLRRPDAALVDRDFLIDSLHLFGLVNFALAQPLYDLLARHAIFFVMRESSGADIVALTLTLSLLVPALLVCSEWIAGRRGEKPRRRVHGFWVALLAAAVFLPPVKKVAAGFLPGAGLISAACVLGAWTLILLRRFRPARTFLTALSLAAAAFPCLFLAAQPIRNMLVSGVESVFYTHVAKPAPVVFVVFDEFDRSSLLNERRRIDAVRYPHFAALAKDSTWFREATGVSDGTSLALPAILTGSYPGLDGHLPLTYSYYPRNLFTLLGRTYEMNVFGSARKMCPSPLCKEEAFIEDAAQRMRGLILDCFLVYLHIVLPEDIVFILPSITQKWKNFRGDQSQELHDGPLAVYGKFMDSLAPAGGRPALYFAHITLPHATWRFFPSGRAYAAPDEIPDGFDLQNGLCSRDDWLVTQAHQRYLLQVGFVDHLLGDLVAKLKALGLYDQSLIIVTADHGVNIRPGMHNRKLSKVNAAELLYVPLFVKAPNQRAALVSDRNVETIDIIATVAELLGIAIPWPMDGQSAFDTNRPERRKKIAVTSVKPRKMIFHAPLQDAAEAFKRRAAVFGSGTPWREIFNIGSRKEIIERSAEALADGDSPDLTVVVERENRYARVDPGSDDVPCLIRGRLSGPRARRTPLYLAVAVNGIIRAVTRSVPSASKGAVFSVLVPEDALRRGRNEIECYLLLDSGRLLRVPRAR